MLISFFIVVNRCFAGQSCKIAGAFYISCKSAGQNVKREASRRGCFSFCQILKRLLAGLAVHHAAQHGAKVRQRHGAQVLTGTGADGDGARLHVAVAHHQHVGDLLQRGLADLLAHLLVAAVHLHAEALAVQLGGGGLGVLGGAVGHGQDLDLHRRQPRGERTGKVLGDNADEALDGAQQRTVDHNGAVPLAVLADVLQLKAFGHLEVQLDGAALPGAAQRISQMEVQLRAVERAVTGVDDEVLAHLGDGRLQRILGEPPVLLVAHVVVGHSGQLDLIRQAERGIDLVEQLHNVLDLVLHLSRGHEDVRIVLRKAADAEQAVQRAGHLVAVDKAQLRHAQGQVAVGVRLALVDQHAAGAVHGLDGVVLAVDDGGIHIVLVVIPVAAAVPQLLIQDDGRGDLHIAVALVALAPVVQQGVFQHHALGQEEREARTLVGHHEQAQLLAELAVVAALGLLQTLKIGVQLLLLGEGHAVDALQGLAIGVAAPIGGVAGGQLDAVALDAAGGVHMRAGAQVDELALLVEGDMGIGGQVVDELHLVGLLLLLHELQGLLAGQLEALQLQLLLADFAHLRLDLRQMLRRKGEGCVQIVVKAAVDAGADSQLHLRPQALHGLRQNVGAGMPVGLAVLLVFKGVVFFAHDRVLLVVGGGHKNNPTPDVCQG